MINRQAAFTWVCMHELLRSWIWQILSIHVKSCHLLQQLFYDLRFDNFNYTPPKVTRQVSTFRVVWVPRTFVRGRTTAIEQARIQRTSCRTRLQTIFIRVEKLNICTPRGLLDEVIARIAANLWCQHRCQMVPSEVIEPYKKGSYNAMTDKFSMPGDSLARSGPLVAMCFHIRRQWCCRVKSTKIYLINQSTADFMEAYTCTDSIQAPVS